MLKMSGNWSPKTRLPKWIEMSSVQQIRPQKGRVSHIWCRKHDRQPFGYLTSARRDRGKMPALTRKAQTKRAKDQAKDRKWDKSIHQAIHWIYNDKAYPAFLHNVHATGEAHCTDNRQKYTSTNRHASSMFLVSLTTLEYHKKNCMSRHKPNQDRKQGPPDLQAHIEWQQKVHPLGEVLSYTQTNLVAEWLESWSFSSG